MENKLIKRCFHVETDSIENIFFLTLKSYLGIIRDNIEVKILQ